MTPKAGRELDARVAVEVMGWKKEPVHPKTPYYVKFIDEKGKRRYIDHPEMPLRGLSWRPSTNIAAAWEVLEKVRENHTVDIHEYSEGWEVVLIGPGSVAFDGQANTVPLAICLAALAAVGASE